MIKMHHGQASCYTGYSLIPYKYGNSLHMHVYTLAILNTLTGTIHDILFNFTNKVYRINRSFCKINIYSLNSLAYITHCCTLPQHLRTLITQSSLQTEALYNKLTFPLMLGSLVGSIRPTSQVSILPTGSNVYFPCEGVKVRFSTDLGKGTSKDMFST